MQHNCPVCNKSGLPDFTTTITICPQCNSDLKPFYLLHSISSAKARKMFLFSVAGAILVSFVFAFLYLHSLSVKKQVIRDFSREISQINDSIGFLKKSLEKSYSLHNEANASEKEIVIVYNVRKGDYVSKIAKFFYNDWEMYKKVEFDNNLKRPYLLYIGQPLTIKINQKKWK